VVHFLPFIFNMAAEDISLSEATKAINSQKSTSYSSCNGEVLVDDQISYPFPAFAHRVARRQHLARMRNFVMFRGKILAVEPEGVSVMETAVNVMNMTIGAGVLVLPFAVQSAGWVILIVLAAWSCWCCASHWMIGAMLAEVDESARASGIPRACRGWNVIAEAALGQVGRQIVEVLVWMECYGMQISYLILTGRSLNLLVPSVPAQVHILCIGPLLALLLLVPLRHFAVFSILGCLSYMAICLAITTTGIELGGAEHVYDQHRTFIVPQHLLSSMGIVNFLYNGHVAAPTFYQAMQNRSAWPVAVSWAMLGIFGFCSAFGLGSYAIFGEASQQSVLENVGRGMDRAILKEPLSEASNRLMSNACGALLALKLIVSLPTFALPVISSIEYLVDVQEQTLTQHIGRTVYTVATAALAALLSDKLAAVMSMVGSITNNAISYLLPAMLYLIIKWDRLNSIERALALISFVQMLAGLWIGAMDITM